MDERGSMATALLDMTVHKERCGVQTRRDRDSRRYLILPSAYGPPIGKKIASGDKA
ncbi:MAG TPA: hypothetical protein VGA48_05965 [Thermoplasmata archaeon]